MIYTDAHMACNLGRWNTVQVRLGGRPVHSRDAKAPAGGIGAASREAQAGFSGGAFRSRGSRLASNRRQNPAGDFGGLGC
jgi:hypothetical protein